ncbi:protein O-mannosyl-transferase TMTC4 isoform X2 [Bicyclus anynana]|uniref:dolichyl-phosphate-mannose--protein mannosyltransferase n=1 Tax=Bicyclus anynana TaxID=110368 RepID=A0ABM3LE17_BICAN|nr:protein O-mannosyl-transferase TMTC4 isoform X2 [Bicyclus anynana]
MYFKLFIIFTVSAAPFLFSLHGDFVFDDSEAIVKNKDVTSKSWLDSFSNDFWGTNIKSNHSHKSYRPLTILTYRLNYIINNRQLSATQFKVINLICHIICCVLVWKTYSCIWARVKWKNEEKYAIDVPFLASLLFSVHPIHVEAISGIVGRADLLAAMTFLLSFLIYDVSMKKKSIFNIYLCISITLAGLSMLFKENGITVMGVCCLYDIILSIRIKALDKLKYKTTNLLKCIHIDVKCVYRTVILITFAILFLYARWIVMGTAKPEFKAIDNPAAFSNNLFTKTATYNYIYFLNIMLLIWPQWLCYDWSMGCVPLINNVLDFRILFISIMYLYLFLFIKAVCSRNYRKTSKRILFLATLFILIPFLPASNIIFPVGFVIAERILYIPSIGYCLFVVIGLRNILQNTRNNQKVFLGIFLGLILIYGMKSWQRAHDWQNEYKLFTNALSVCPLNAKVHYNIAKVADAKENSSWAIDEYTAAIRLYPEYYQAMNNLANLLKNKKEFSAAEAYLRKAINHKKDFPAAWMNLGIVLANTKRYIESQKAYKTALLYRKNYPDCFYNLGNLYLEMNKTDDAMESWYQAINLNPKHVSAWTNLLALLDNTRVLYHRWQKYDLAKRMYKKALTIDPNFPSANKNLYNLEKFKMKK